MGRKKKTAPAEEVEIKVEAPVLEEEVKVEAVEPVKEEAEVK